MSFVDRLWEATKFLIRIGDKVERLNERSVAQQKTIDSLRERVLRLEILTQLNSGQAIPPKSIDFPDSQPPG